MTLWALALVGCHAHAQAQAPATAITFDGKAFVHRWSKQGQHEFTPTGEDDLARWREMVTIDVHNRVSTGGELADVANRVLANYQRHGKIVRTDSRPRTPEHPAEHFVAAMLAGQSLFEATFARFMLVDGVGAVVVYSRRFYGSEAAADVADWVRAHGPTVEHTLMAWNGMPSIRALNGLPESK